MQLELDYRLIEEAVFLMMRKRASQCGDSDFQRTFRNRLDAAYELFDGVACRESAFNEIYADYFAQLGFADLLHRVLRELPLLAQRLDRLSFLPVATHREEAAELIVRAAERNGETEHREAIVGVRAERFPDPGPLETWLLQELVHVSDMLDPAFGYEPTVGNQETVARENLVRDRFKVVWDCYVDARLTHAGRIPESSLAGRDATTARVFGCRSEDLTSEIHARVRCGQSLRYEELLKWARDG